MAFDSLEAMRGLACAVTGLLLFAACRNWDTYDPRLQESGGDGGATTTTQSGGAGGMTSAGGEGGSGVGGSGGVGGTGSGGTGGGDPPGCNDIALASDDFAGQVLDEKWFSFFNGAAAVNLQDGELVLTATPDDRAGIGTRGFYDFRNNAIVFTLGSLSNAHDLDLTLFAPGHVEELEWNIYDGVIEAAYHLDGSHIGLDVRTFVADQHLLLRIRHDGTDVVFESAESGGNDWEEHARLESFDLFPLELMRVELEEGHADAPSESRIVRVDGGDASNAKYCPLSGQTDDFSDPNDVKWSNWQDDGCFATETGALVFHLDADTSTGCGYEDLRLRDFTDSSATVEIVQPPPDATGELIFAVISPERHDWVVIKVTGEAIEASRVEDDIWQSQPPVPFDASQHRFLRFRAESSGVVSYETSPDGVRWEGLYATDAPFELDRVQLLLGGWSYDVGNPSMEIAFGNLNILP